MLRKFIGILLFLSIAANIAGLALFDRTLFYRNKIAIDEADFLNEGVRIISTAAISQADLPNLGVLLGGSLFRYWFAPVDGNFLLVNYGDVEEKSKDTYAKVKKVAAELTPEFVLINAGFCEIHTAVHNDKDVEKAFDINMHYLRLMIEEMKSNDILPIMTSLPPVRSKHLLPSSGWFELPSEKKKLENNALQTYNKMIVEMAQSENLPFIDFNKILTDKTGRLRKEFSLTDGEHLNRNGYQMLNEFFVSQLETILAKEKM